MKLFHTGVGIRKSLCRLLLRDVIVIFFFFFGEVIKTETVLFFLFFCIGSRCSLVIQSCYPNLQINGMSMCQLTQKSPGSSRSKGRFLACRMLFFRVTTDNCRRTCFLQKLTEVRGDLTAREFGGFSYQFWRWHAFIRLYALDVVSVSRHLPVPSNEVKSCHQ